MKILKNNKFISRGKSVASVLHKVSALKKAEQLNAEQFKSLRENRFRKLLRHVLAKSSFYRNYYKNKGIDINNPDTISLQDLPPVNKNIMMDNFDHLVCDSKLKKARLEEFIIDPSRIGTKYLGKYQVIHTSGSTGRVGIFVYGPQDWDMLRAMVFTRVAKSSFSFLRRRKIVFIGATGGHYAGISLSQETGKLFADFLPLSINNSLGEINRKINRFQPDTITGYASAVNMLAGEQLKKNINVCPNQIFCFADHLTPGMRSNIKQAFGIEPVNLYGASESISMAVQYSSQEGFHVFDDWHYFEVVDRFFNPVPLGSPGILLLTNLYNYTQPLIRYQINDEIILENASGAQARQHLVIKSIGGRREDFLWFDKKDGTKEFIHPLVIVELFAPGLEKFQIIQTSQNNLLVKVITRNDRAAAIKVLREKIQAILKDKQLDNNVAVDFETVDVIPSDPKTGKFKLIIPYNE